jgi:hypothetical protein
MRFRDLLNETTVKQQFKNVDDLIKWIDTLQIPKRKPTVISKVEHSGMLNLITKISEYTHTINQQEKTFYTTIILNASGYLRLDVKEYENIYADKKQPLTVQKKYATYIKFDASAYDNFLKNIDVLEKFLVTLKGYHKKPLKNLKIKFVSRNEIRSKASYKTDEDTLYINAKRMGGTTDGYGSLVYVVLHELGHRYLNYNPQNWKIDDLLYTTTDYSRKDSFTGEEKFAELFALTHWPKKYKEHKEKMDLFKRIIK